jgi:chorismate mutase
MKETIISGPCSIESLEQYESTISELIKIGITEIRGGAWKPRTNQGQFEGLGEDALKIIKKAKEKYFFKSYVEVANREQVLLCEKYDIDCFWIGARTTGNPFSIQEIVDSISNKSRRILIKNPINYDIKLWAGAINRFHSAGIKNVSIVFRGFNSHSTYRFNPIFDAIDELKNQIGNNIDTYIDVSHIAGKRDYLSEVISKSKSLGYDKFMIESHIEPDNAITDSLQQIKPSELINYLSNECLLKYERSQIDHIDNEIINLISQRISNVQSIGRYKKTKGVDVYDEQRYIEVLKRYGSLSNIYEEIHSMSVKIQENI